MKKIYFTLILLISVVIVSKAQVNKLKNQGNVINPYSDLKKNVLNKSTNCIDSIRYPQSKLSGSPETGSLTNNTALQTGISQAFHYSGTGSVHGIGAYLLLDFDGVPGNFNSVLAKIKIYNIDSQNYPTSVIDSATVQVADVGFNEQVLMFSSPIAVSDSFAIAIEMGSFNAITDTIFYTTNICAWNGTICTVGDGNNEDLSCVLSPDFLSANGSNWFNNNIEVFGWNIDFLMHPIIEDTIISSYTTDQDTIYPNDTVVFTNTSIHITDAMFNLYNTSTNPLYTWDFDDGSGTYNPFDTSYVFANPGDYNTKLTANYYGYTLNCMDTDSSLVHVNFALALEEEIGAKTVSVYPIPAKTYFNVNIPNKYLGGEIIVSDVVGKIILSKQIQNESKVKMTTEGLVSGVYFVSLAIQGERVYTQRIVINK
ncbi:MAG: T9SS type A sorting domain-containing protein [Vicingaceae bacterium]|nr:T9SS type A sorting domain-containing protein [Vicingaceae bacterium]